MLDPAPPRLSPVRMEGSGREELDPGGDLKAVPTGALREALGEVSGSGGGLSQTSCTMGGRVYLFFLGFLFTERRD